MSPEWSSSAGGRQPALSPAPSPAGGWTAEDSRFVEAVESCTLPEEQFSHRSHLRLAWLYLRAQPYAVAVRRIERTTKRYAAHLGAAEKYHHTMTLTWMRLVAAAAASAPDVERFHAFLEAHPDLLDAGTPKRFYSAERLATSTARSSWVEPDLRPLPGVPAARLSARRGRA